MKKVCCALFLIAILALGSKQTRAYFPIEIRSAQGNIVAYKWDASTMPITWQMDPVQPANVSGLQTQATVITQSFQSWQSVAAVSLRQGSNISGKKFNTLDGINLITTNTSPTDLPVGALAVTFPFSFKNGGPGFVDGRGRPILYPGQILEADMAFNSSFQFSTNTASVSNLIDLQSVATHEAGHFLGLDHATNVSSTMYWATGYGSIYQRNLSADDIAGISMLYPPATFAGKGTLKGTVRTTGNEPVYGAIVVAVDSNGTPVASTVTDPNGEYIIQGLDPGSYTVFAEPLGGRIAAEAIGSLGDIYPGSTVNSGFTTRYH
jgi:hypothetical protein